MRRAYGLSLADFNIHCSAQKFLCACCGDFLEKPQIDHCHKTGKFRGILCRGCNTGLGNFRDDPVRLQKAIRYILLTKIPV